MFAAVPLGGRVIASAARDSTAAHGVFGRDSAGTWLPVESAELESPDRLEGSDPIKGVGVRADWRDGRVAPRHAWVDGGGGLFEDVRAEWLLRRGAADWATLRVRPAARGATVAAGAIVARALPALLGEALGLLRPLRAPRSPALRTPALEGPRGPSSAAVRGGAAAVSVGPAGAWALAGRGDEDAAVRAGGVTIRLGAFEAATAAGSSSGGRRSASIALGAESPHARFAAEALLTAGRGPELLAEAIRRAGAFGAEARWRHRPGEARPAAGELVVRSDTRAARTRLRWTPWSARAAGDDGRVELEATLGLAGLGPARFRVGARNGEAASTVDAAGRVERYLIADVVLARERGRSFALLASAREQRRAGGAAVASAVGGRLEIVDPGRPGDRRARGRAGVVLVLQARRTASAGWDGAVPSPWVAAVAPSGAETLDARSGSGLAVSGRAWLRLGPLRLEGHVSDASAPEGEKSSIGSLRIEWEREEP